MVSTLLMLLLTGMEPDAGPAPAPRGETKRETSRVTLLSGDSIDGSIVDWNEHGLKVRSGKRDVQVAAKDLLSLDLATPPAGPPAAVRILTSDGSELVGSSFQSDGKSAELVLLSGEKLEMEVRRVRAMLRGDGVDAWRRTAQVERTQDLLTVVKDGTPFSLEGIVARVGPESLAFLLDGEEVPVRLERVVSIHHSNAAKGASTRAELFDRFGNRWAARALTPGMTTLRIETELGSRTLARSDLCRVDFASGKLRFLSDLDPALVAYVPYFDFPWEYRRDRNLAGGPLKLQGVPFAKGLSLHSKTLLEYPLDGAYDRFEATLGIDDSAGPLGDATVRILGDQRVLAEYRVQAGHPPQPISLPTRGVALLGLEVDFGANLDLGDQVVLGAARLVRGE